ncbi:MAG: Gx transporter family protein [Oscillospiraceae bacterium]|nr:Gx transporter family protein [Oscillospiraceae bacterium]MBR6207582.1 Gx transporter family protein [Oscillospiraceae bacterium]
MKNRTLAELSLLCALAMILSYLESLVPIPIPVPGIKLGLANLAVVFAVYRLGIRQAAAVSLVRVVTIALLFGSVLSLAYSLSGAALSLLSMALLKAAKRFSPWAVSVAGGVAHNIGQLLAAAVLLETRLFLYYLPVLMLSGVVCGAAIGILAAVLIRRVRRPE